MSERNNLEDSGVDGRIILKWFFRIGMGAGTGLMWVRIAGPSECGNERSGSINCGEFLD
jgi:hypothetical protein